MSGTELVPLDLPVMTHLRQIPAAHGWLDRLPTLIEEVRAAFELRLSPPIPGGSCSWVAPAMLPDGTEAIVKIAWPHREMRGEPAALRRWNGHGAVRLIAHDPRRHALVLHRCVPGDELRTAPGTAEQRLLAGCDVLRRLWQAPPPHRSEDRDGIESLALMAGVWADLADERMARIRPGYDPALVAEGIALLRTLPMSATREAILHGDINPGNVLSTGTGRWVAIDPKPMTGDPAYDPWPLVEQIDDPFSTADPTRVLRHRIEVVAGALALEPERITLWALARRVEAALWAAEHGAVAGGAAIMEEARTLAELRH